MFYMSSQFKPGEYFASHGISGYKTSHGSVYFYDKDGTTRRYRTADDTMRPRKNLSVFLNPQDEKYGLLSMRVGKLLVGETSDEREGRGGRIIRHVNEVVLPDALKILLPGDADDINSGSDELGIVASMPVLLLPTIGHHPLEMTFHPDGSSTRHLGDPVVKIYTE